jgi:hypothetical protein
MVAAGRQTDFCERWRLVWSSRIAIHKWLSVDRLAVKEPADHQ